MSFQIDLTLYPSGLPVQDAGGYVNHKTFNYNWSTAQASGIIWNPAGTRRIHLRGVALSTDTAQTIWLGASGVNYVIPPVYSSTYGNANISGEGELWMGASGIYLTISSSENGNLSCTVWGYEEGHI